MNSELTQLKKNKCCYIGSTAPTRRCEMALALAEEFFYRTGFMQHCDLLVVADRKKQKVTLRLHNDKFNLSFRTYRKSPPDLIWLDKAEWAMPKEFKGIPTIYSCGRPNKISGPRIIVDSKEQLPLFIGDTFQKQSLLVGDYTTEKLLNRFHIERKSPQDLYGTITKGHVRFRNELIRAEVYGIKLVMYVECSKKNFVAKKFPGGSARLTSGKTLGKIVTTIEDRYKMEVVWCNSRNTTKSKVLQRFFKEERNNRRPKMSK